MIRIRALDHLVLRVADLDKMLRFYSEALGCHTERRQASRFREIDNRRSKIEDGFAQESPNRPIRWSARYNKSVA